MLLNSKDWAIGNPCELWDLAEQSAGRTLNLRQQRNVSRSRMSDNSHVSIVTFARPRSTYRQHRERAEAMQDTKAPIGTHPGGALKVQAPPNPIKRRRP